MHGAYASNGHIAALAGSALQVALLDRIPDGGFARIYGGRIVQNTQSMEMNAVTCVRLVDIMKYGGDCQVISPKALRDRVVVELDRARKCYRS